MVSLPTSSDEEYDCDYGETPFEEEHKGLPESCFCGGDAILETKRTGLDAGRLYFRCGNSRDQDSTGHLGKWFDTAVEEELQIMQKDIKSLQCQSRVDCDYVNRLCALEGSHDKMKVTVAWLAEEVEGWMDNFKLHALETVEKQVACERFWRRVLDVVSLRTNKIGVAIAVAVLTRFIAGWRLRDFM